MDLSEFDYDLPAESIAQTPAPARDASRLLLIDRARGAFADHGFAELPDLLRPGDCLVLNNSRVIPARVAARDARGRPVEVLFLVPETDRRWWALVRPGRRCRPGSVLTVGEDGATRLGVLDVAEDGSRALEWPDGPIAEMLERYGVPPLPPYIARHAAPTPDDRERYQTVYAKPPGSVAAPTAGLHFTPGLLEAIRARGIEVHELTLHVGLATFQPVRTPLVELHRVGPERVRIPQAVARAVNGARREGRRVVAVGTTTTRALEGAALGGRALEAVEGQVDLTVTPGHRFRVVDALLTNFHLPRSSLLVLVSAFAGRELILKAYHHAVRSGYRFYSYGDATLIQ